MEITSNPTTAPIFCEGVTLNGQPLAFSPDEPMPEAWHTLEQDEEWADPYCFVCGRCTDHVGEHDDLVEVGAADYRGYEVLVLDRERMNEWLAVLRFMVLALRADWWEFYPGLWGEEWERRSARKR